MDILQKIFMYAENAKDLIGEIEDTKTTDSLKKLHTAYNYLCIAKNVIENYKESGKNEGNQQSKRNVRKKIRRN